MKKPVQLALKRVGDITASRTSLLAAFVLGLNPGARKQSQIGASAYRNAKAADRKIRESVPTRYYFPGIILH
jgi:hypothetical protein